MEDRHAPHECGATDRRCSEECHTMCLIHVDLPAERARPIDCRRMGPTTSDLPAALSDALARAPVPGVVAAYLFGSHAAGRAHRESDVDVGVLFDWDALPTTRERFDAGVRLASWLMAELRHPRVDLVVLNDAPPVLARHVTV